MYQSKTLIAFDFETRGMPFSGNRADGQPAGEMYAWWMYVELPSGEALFDGGGRLTTPEKGTTDDFFDEKVAPACESMSVTTEGSQELRHQWWGNFKSVITKLKEEGKDYEFIVHCPFPVESFHWGKAMEDEPGSVWDFGPGAYMRSVESELARKGHNQWSVDGFLKENHPHLLEVVGDDGTALNPHHPKTDCVRAVRAYKALLAE